MGVTSAGLRNPLQISWQFLIDPARRTSKKKTINPEDMRMAVTTPAFQPYRGETGRAWMAKEYGITMDTSSIMSSETERDDTDDEICSFDLGPEPYDPSGQ